MTTQNKSKGTQARRARPRHGSRSRAEESVEWSIRGPGIRVDLRVTEAARLAELARAWQALCDGVAALGTAGHGQQGQPVFAQATAPSLSDIVGSMEDAELNLWLQAIGSERERRGAVSS